MKSTRNIILILFSFISCINSSTFSDIKSIPNAKWNVKNILRIEYYSSDTLQIKDILLNLRHSSAYPYANIFFFITTLAPNGSSVKDTVQYFLVDNKNNWLGKGIGDIHNIQLLFKKNVRFGQVGRYIFYIQHGMRDEVLDGVSDVGIVIKNCTEQ